MVLKLERLLCWQNSLLKEFPLRFQVYDQESNSTLSLNFLDSISSI